MNFFKDLFSKSNSEKPGELKKYWTAGKCDHSIVQEDDGGYSYGLHPQSHLLDDLKHIIVEGRE